MKTIGIGVLLQTHNETFVFQDRDEHAPIHPGRITSFGGGIEGDEDVYQCARRELLEELMLDLEEADLKDVGLFASRHEPGIYIQMFLVNGIDKSLLRLQEGKDIVEFSLEEALQNEQVTDFTKEVLRLL
jgi:8-oxo-dGTP pyrophosphatase MutT (NUDIX family)